MAAVKGKQRVPREKPQQIADELRSLIVSGQLEEGALLGREPELVERFGVSPRLRRVTPLGLSTTGEPTWPLSAE